MKLPVYFSFLCFLLLFAHRIKAFEENDGEEIEEFSDDDDLINVENDYDLKTFDSALASAATATNKTGHCDKDQFKCSKSGECIDRYKVTKSVTFW